MAVGKKRRLTKHSKKGIKKKIVDPFSKKDDMKAPSQLAVRQIGKKIARRKNRGFKCEPEDSKWQEEVIVDDRLTKKILKQAALQQQEVEDEDETSSSDDDDDEDDKDEDMEEQQEQKGNTDKRPSLRQPIRSGEQSSEDEEEVDEEAMAAYEAEELIIDEDDEKMMSMFTKKSLPMADLVARLTEKKTEVESVMSVGGLDFQDMDPRVISMFKDIGGILSKYRSGKLPKAFKIVPSMSNWEQILHLTSPDKWTAAAVYQATRIFSSNLKAKMAQRFYNLVLLPRIRDDIAEFKRLNFHLYQALNKSLFKPAAFYKGIIIPLCESGTCTLREAVIVASVISKHSVPMLHSAAALLRLAEMPYTGASSVFMRTLLDKKYALPYRVLDAIVGHFMQFETHPGPFPVLWHQCLLCFCQRYKEDISVEQKEALGRVAKAHKHPEISPLIHIELAHNKSRVTVTEDMQ